MEPSKGLVGAKLGQVGSLGGDLGAMLGSKIGLGSLLGVIFGPSWAQEPMKTPKGEAPEPIKTPQSEEVGLQERPRASLGPPNLEPKSNINQHTMKQTINIFDIILELIFHRFYKDFGSQHGANIHQKSIKNKKILIFASLL